MVSVEYASCYRALRTAARHSQCGGRVDSVASAHGWRRDVDGDVRASRMHRGRARQLPPCMLATRRWTVASLHSEPL